MTTPPLLARAASASRACRQCVNRPAARRGLCDTCYGITRARLQAYGRWESQHVDAQPAREHVEQLLAAGLGTRRIADLAGVSRLSIQRLLNGRGDIGTGPTKMLRRTTAAKLLAVPAPEISWHNAARAALVDGTGTRRRLQALIADGHTLTALDVALGWSRGSLSKILNRPGPVTAGTAHSVAELFARLQLTPGADERSRRRGALNGWALPMQWDEDEIDDPHATPRRVRRPGPAARAAAAPQPRAVQLPIRDDADAEAS